MWIPVHEMRAIAQAFAVRKELETDHLMCRYRPSSGVGHLFIVQMRQRNDYVIQEDWRGSISFVDISRARTLTLSPHGFGLARMVNEVCAALGDKPRVYYAGSDCFAWDDGTPFQHVGRCSLLLYNPMAYMALRAAKGLTPAISTTTVVNV